MHILCAGISVLDHIFQVDHFPIPGEKSRASNFTESSGGNAANAAIAIARLGGQVALASPLASDLIGDSIVARLTAENVDCAAMVRVAGAISSLSAIIVDATGERMIVNRRDETLSKARVANVEALVESLDAVLIDNRFPEFVLPIAQAARRHNLPVVLDADEPSGFVDEIFAASTHVIFSAHGLRATAECADPEQALRIVAGPAPAFFAVTSGPNGTLWRHGTESGRQAAFPVRAVDTLGAGDVYHGAFTLALGEGRTVPEALRFAAAAAAVKCTRFGGITGAPKRQDVENFLRAA